MVHLWALADSLSRAGTVSLPWDPCLQRPCFLLVGPLPVAPSPADSQALPLTTPAYTCHDCAFPATQGLSACCPSLGPLPFVPTSSSRYSVSPRPKSWERNPLFELISPSLGAAGS